MQMSISCVDRWGGFLRRRRRRPRSGMTRRPGQEKCPGFFRPGRRRGAAAARVAREKDGTERLRRSGGHFLSLRPCRVAAGVFPCYHDLAKGVKIPPQHSELEVTRESRFAAVAAPLQSVARLHRVDGG